MSSSSSYLDEVVAREIQILKNNMLEYIRDLRLSYEPPPFLEAFVVFHEASSKRTLPPKKEETAPPPCESPDLLLGKKRMKEEECEDEMKSNVKARARFHDHFKNEPEEMKQLLEKLSKEQHSSDPDYCEKWFDARVNEDLAVKASWNEARERFKERFSEEDAAYILAKHPKIKSGEPKLAFMKRSVAWLNAQETIEDISKRYVEVRKAFETRFPSEALRKQREKNMPKYEPEQNKREFALIMIEWLNAQHPELTEDDLRNRLEAVKAQFKTKYPDENVRNKILANKPTNKPNETTSAYRLRLLKWYKTKGCGK